MRLRTKLVLAATGVTFAIAIVLSLLFLGELLNQRILQTAASNDVLAHQVQMMARKALETGLREHPPVDGSDAALRAAVGDALRNSTALTDTMNGFVRYSPAVQDVSVVDAAGQTLVATEPQTLERQATDRVSFNRVRDAGVRYQMAEMFGPARVLDVTAPLERNGVPFLVVHVGVRSTFLRNNYVPWLKDAFWLALLSGLISMIVAGVLVRVAVAPAANRMEQELEVSRRLAAVGRLTAGVGHEVKNPINAMVVHLELLRGKLEKGGEGREFLLPAMRHVEVLSGEMQRLDRVVQTLADFTRPMDLRLEDVDLSTMVAGAVLELTGAEMAELGVSVKADLNTVMVRGDAELLRQALLNLVLNGMQAMTEGNAHSGRCLHIGVRRERDSGVIEIADEGMGIAEELLPRIFDLYFTTREKGSGIGLAMTYRIVQMHGGSVEVRSGSGFEAGLGAVFTIRLPALARRPVTNGARGLLAGRAA